jgi:dodecin
MAVLKVIELMAESPTSWENATQMAATKAAKTLKGVRSVWVKDMSAHVDKAGKITSYRVTCKVSFEIKDMKD